MEPLFFKAENAFALSRYFFAGASFNGAAFFQSGKCRKAQEKLYELPDALQWSRFFSKRKISQESFCLRRSGRASMEPLFFKAENKQRVVIIADNDTLQWSRFFSKRKIPQTVMPLSGKVASMEPLFFKAENLATALAFLARFYRFNGAAFFQSGKLDKVISVVDAVSASMEPLFFKAENAARCRWRRCPQ